MDPRGCAFDFAQLVGIDYWSPAGSGAVHLDDINLTLKTYGNLNEDGNVDGQDLNILLSDFPGTYTQDNLA